MSATILYRLGKHPNQIGRCPNAFRSAMYVWTDISKRYFNLSSFPMLDEAAQSRVWQAYKHVKNAPVGMKPISKTVESQAFEGARTQANKNHSVFLDMLIRRNT